MKIFYLSLFIFTHSIIAEEDNSRCAKCSEQSDKTAQVVLANFANILTHFGKIVSDPHNKENVQQQICNIAASVATVAAETVKSGKISQNPEDIYKFLMSLNLESQLQEVIATKMHEIKSNLKDPQEQEEEFFQFLNDENNFCWN